MDIPIRENIASQFGSFTKSRKKMMKQGRNNSEIGESMCALTLSTIIPKSDKKATVTNMVTTPQVDMNFLLSASFSKYPESTKVVSQSKKYSCEAT